MTTSDASWSARLRMVGDLERPDHFYLDDTDRCAYFGDYTARAGFAHSYTNQIISNLKKSPLVRHTAQWPHKEKAIVTIGAAVANNVATNGWQNTAFVPMPSSKRPDSPEYDDRMVQVARAMGHNADVRELLYTAVERNAMHTSAERRDPDALRASLAVNHQLTGNPRPHVVLLDDVLTTGCSFKVCKEMIAEIWPGTQVTGVFVARRVIPNPFAALDLD
ncbi:hypothetical protein [Sinorhizobium saheli]|uniref:Amidophosphoribosyltransferase n=1 Tax=Sinorhizobium saheli TaxID=36856 RepID=A0A178XY79_SINSA|nr:hypothetical protein [Sinorhizobium saheli]MQW86391.1 hypothetical protein [Sinorhizobium saheli]OAP39693.1 hypothetical protein ATB98_05085 [Sinorhizobium saheli]